MKTCCLTRIVLVDLNASRSLDYASHAGFAHSRLHALRLDEALADRLEQRLLQLLLQVLLHRVAQVVRIALLGVVQKAETRNAGGGQKLVQSTQNDPVRREKKVQSNQFGYDHGTVQLPTWCH